MTDSEKIQILLEKSAIMEEAIKMLLMNDVLKDAENLTASPSDSSQQQEEYEQKITELQKILKIKDDKISTLQRQSDVLPRLKRRGLPV